MFADDGLCAGIRTPAAAVQAGRMGDVRAPTHLPPYRLQHLQQQQHPS